MHSMYRSIIDPPAIPGMSDELRAKLDEIMARNVRWPGWVMEDEGKEDDEQEEGGEGKEDEEGGEGKEDEDPDEPLGQAGTKALQAEKTKRREAQKALREFRELGLTPAQIRELTAAKDGKPAGDKVDVDKIRQEARAEVEKANVAERVQDKIEAKARGFADPEDAVAILLRSHDVEDFLDDNGKIDATEIEAALSELLEKKPHLAAAQGGDDKRFKGSADGGTRKGSKPGQLTREDVRKLKATPGGDAKIVEAKKAGRLNDLLGIK